MEFFLLNDFEKAGWVSSYQCCVTLYSFVAFGLILVGTFNQGFLMDEVQQFYGDWEQPLIRDVRIQEECQGGYVNVLNYEWPGVINGCDCRDASGDSDFVYKGLYYVECSEFMLKQHCTPVEPLEQTQFNMWPLPSNDGTEHIGHSVCVLFSQLTLDTAYWRNEEPLNGFKKCGKLIQVPELEECPVSGIKLNIKNEGIRVGNLKYTFQVERVKDLEVPLKGFHIGFDEICYTNGELVNFNVLDELFKYQCDVTDLRYSQVSLPESITYESLLDVNDVLADYIDTIDDEDEFTKEYINLFGVHFTQFQYNPDTCPTSEYRFIRDATFYINNNIYNIQLTSQLMIGILAGVFGFLIPLAICISLVGCDFQFMTLSKKDQAFKDVFKFWLAVKLFNETICTTVLACNYAYQNYILSGIESFIDNKCSDPTTLQQLGDFKYNFTTQVHYYVLLDFLLCLIVMCIDFCVTFVMFRDKQQHCQKSIIIQPKQSSIVLGSGVLGIAQRKFSDREIPNDLNDNKHTPMEY